MLACPHRAVEAAPLRTPAFPIVEAGDRLPLQPAACVPWLLTRFVAGTRAPPLPPAFAEAATRGRRVFPEQADDIGELGPAGGAHCGLAHPRADRRATPCIVDRA